MKTADAEAPYDLGHARPAARRADADEGGLRGVPGPACRGAQAAGRDVPAGGRRVRRRWEATLTAPRNDAQRPRLGSMDRIYLAIIAAAILVMVGAFSLYVTKAGEFAPARTIGAARLFK